MNGIKILFCLFFALIELNAQNKNHVEILSTDNYNDIIKKAANVSPSPRQLRWQKLEVTAFFHFGINTFYDKERGDGREDISKFNPTELDANQWISVVKNAGVKQVIITAKHHDGFCLWPSKYTDHSVKNAPYKNGKGDVVKEVSQACKINGIGFGIYLSPWDRNSKYYGDSAKYNEYFINQLTELLTNYGTVQEVWFDGACGEGANGKKQVYNFDAWYALIRKLQPEAVIAVMGPDVRWVGTETGEGRETEWSVLPTDEKLQTKIAASSQTDITFSPNGDMMENDLGSRAKIMNAKGLIWYPAETDVSIRPGWFYHAAEDQKVKTADELVKIYFTSVGRNSLLLLNIPPNQQGLISKYDVQNLLAWRNKMNEIFDNELFSTAGIVENKNKILPSDFLKNISKINDSAQTIEFTFTQSVTFNVLSLQEEIEVGQRVEKFYAKYFDEDKKVWQTFTTGTTIGYKRLLTFDKVKAQKIRIQIEASRLNPVLNNFGFYLMEE